MSARHFRDDLSALCDEPMALSDYPVASVDLTIIDKSVWFIWQKKGHPPRFAHQSEDDANQEALRLARKYPGNSFIVMHAVRKFRVEEAAKPTDALNLTDAGERALMMGAVQ